MRDEQKLGNTAFHKRMEEWDKVAEMPIKLVIHEIGEQLIEEFKGINEKLQKFLNFMEESEEERPQIHFEKPACTGRVIQPNIRPRLNKGMEVIDNGS
jgi:hypothetical protein